ncbi:MAG TPA: DUF512 domain-containing protein [Clostridia bacterium]|nr:DUF512 domain-containing protein [Clostridia bacterium]
MRVEDGRKKHLITSVEPHSPADASGITRGVYLVSIDGEPVEDIIDYEQLTASESLRVETEDEAGRTAKYLVEKDEYEPLGLGFATSLMSSVRACGNRCLFCFVDQLPRGGRETLHFKDDDWRLSLIMGNYVTLTNVTDREFERIVKRRVSPLYISVHATDGEVRKAMMRNPSAGRIMERLGKLRNAGLRFHAQIVVCPGINDGGVLERSVEELYAFSPSAQTVAVVPVGLTRFRDGLAPLRGVSKGEAGSIIDFIEAFSAKARRETGEGFVYAADELYAIAGRELPPYEKYDDFPQLENGVGLLRKFGREFMDALVAMEPFRPSRRVSGVTGSSAFAFLKPLLGTLTEYGIEFDLRRVENDYFGRSVTVAGLVTATDIAAQLKGEALGELLVIPDDMLREREDVFLDGRTVAWLERELNVRVKPLCAADGEAYIYGLFDTLREV